MTSFAMVGTALSTRSCVEEARDGTPGGSHDGYDLPQEHDNLGNMLSSLHETRSARTQVLNRDVSAVNKYLGSSCGAHTQ